MEMENDAIPQIASGFAGGIGITGSVCGAVVGAVMAISLKLGKAETMEGRLSSFAVPREFRSRFESEMGTISCSDLTGLDLAEVDLSPEGMEQFMRSNTSQDVCFSAVGTAYRLVVDLLRETT
jgi:C_GCAxxG_C_C family probable redox protein